MPERVAVVGGGAVGVTAARDLAAAGASVTLYERGAPASGASGRAAGIVYDAFAEDRDAAVADRALERFRALDAAGDLAFTDCPYVWFARAGDDRRATAIREQVERMRANHRRVDLLSPADLSDRFPALRSGDVSVAAVARDAGCLDAEAYVRAIADRAREAGATVRTDARVSIRSDGPSVGIGGADQPDPASESTTERFDAVVVAAGAHTPGLLDAAGVPVPVKPYRVQALVTDPIEADPPVWYDATEGYYARPRDGGLLIGDGTEEREFDPDAYDETADESFLATSLERVRQALGVGADVRRAWAGLCTATPDRNPLVGPVDDARGLFVATGWHGHGFMRAPALGERLAAIVRGGDPDSAFDPRRFDGDEEFAVAEGRTVD